MTAAISTLPYHVIPGLTTYDPLDHIRALGYDIVYDIADLGFPVNYEPLGLTSFRHKIVFLDARLLAHELRGTAAHEAAHCERGPFPRHGRKSEENCCDEIAAERLVTAAELVELARGCDSVEELAEAAMLDTPLLLTRISLLSDTEHQRMLRAADHFSWGGSLSTGALRRRRQSSKIRTPLPW